MQEATAALNEQTGICWSQSALSCEIPRAQEISKPKFSWRCQKCLGILLQVPCTILM